MSTSNLTRLDTNLSVVFYQQPAPSAYIPDIHTWQEGQIQGQEFFDMDDWFSIRPQESNVEILD